jgi:hypothetical protein
MRRLTIIVRSSRGALPLVIAAGVTAAHGCGGDTETGTGSAGGTRSDAGTSGGSGGLAGTGASGGLVSVGGAAGVSPFGGAGGSVALGGAGGGLAVGGSGGGMQFCSSFALDSFTVELPPEGTPADPGQICAATMEPVVSNRAARVTLEKLGPAGDLQTARGLVEVDAALLDRVIGTPVIEVIDATDTSLTSLVVSNIQRQPTGYSFDAVFTAPVGATTDGFSRLTARVSLELDCTPSPETRIVHASTDIHLCIGDGDLTWVSSGDQCVVCRVIAEMAPSPIVPDKASDDLPLAQALRLRIVELARISNTVVLLAENDGGDGMEYEWHASGGELTTLAPDVVAWTLVDGMPDPFIQAAVSGPHAVAVASFAFNEAA